MQPAQPVPEDVPDADAGGPRDWDAVRSAVVGFVDHLRRSPVQWAIAFLFGAFLWWLVAEGPLYLLAASQPFLEHKDYLTLVGSYRQTLAQVLGGLLLAAGLYLTYRQIRNTERNLQITRQQVEITRGSLELSREQFRATAQQFADTFATSQANLRLAEQEQLSDRFAKAVEQLGDENIAIRLGGIYLLERLAKDSPPDHGTVMDVLTAYIRERRRWSEGAPLQDLPIDISAILVVLSRRNRAVEPFRPLDLTGIDLRKAELNDIGLEWVVLHRAHLEGASLSSADLSGAYLDYASLDDAWMWAANLEGAHCPGVSIRGATLQSAKLSDAFLSGYLEPDGPDWERWGADLSFANLRDADLRRADLRGAELTSANLETADLRGARLGQANLTGATMQGTDLREGADLRRCVLDAAQLKAAKIDDTTQLDPAVRAAL